MWTLTTDANLVKSIEPGSDEVVEPLYTRAAPKDASYIERAMELAREMRVAVAHEVYRPCAHTSNASNAAIAALRRHLEGGGSADKA